MDDKKTEATRKLIMQAFWELYTDNTLENITVKQIALKAGIHRSTFYLYFQDRYDVLEQIENGILNEYSSVISTLTVETIPNVVYELYYLVQRNGQYLTHLFGMRRDPNFMNRTKKTMEPYLFKLMYELFPNLNPEQEKVLISSIVSMACSFVVNALSQSINQKQASEMLYFLLFNGYLPMLSTIFDIQPSEKCELLKDNWIKFFNHNKETVPSV